MDGLVVLGGSPAAGAVLVSENMHAKSKHRDFAAKSQRVAHSDGVDAVNAAGCVSGHRG